MNTTGYKSIVFSLLTILSLTSYAEDIDINHAPSSAEVSITLSSLVEASGRENLIDLLQHGSYNQAYLNQSGSNNNINLNQIGYNNESQIDQFGYNNSVDINQLGNSNTIEITQIGNENLVQLNQFGETSFSVEQIADNATIIITQY